MSTPLSTAVTALSDPNVRLSDALRSLLVVAHRIGATDLVAVLRSELHGYDTEALPPYRDARGRFPVTIEFEGTMMPPRRRDFLLSDFPSEMRSLIPETVFRHPVAELESLRASDRDPLMPLSLLFLQAYRHLAAAKLIATFQGMQATKAYITLPRHHLDGLLSRLSVASLDLALALESAAPDAGDAGGPTVTSDPSLAGAVTNFINAADGSTVVTGSGNNVASGQGATAIQLQTGDVDGLLKVVRETYGDDAAQELDAALAADGGEPGDHTTSFLDRVKSNGIAITQGVASSAAWQGLVFLLTQVFPSFI